MPHIFSGVARAQVRGHRRFTNLILQTLKTRNTYKAIIIALLLIRPAFERWAGISARVAMRAIEELYTWKWSREGKHMPKVVHVQEAPLKAA